MLKIHILKFFVEGVGIVQHPHSSDWVIGVAILEGFGIVEGHS